MKEFVTYTGLRLLLFVASAAVIFGVWLAVAGHAPIMWVLILALVVSGIGSFFLLNGQRNALARHVDARATRATAAFEEMKAKEDLD